MAEWMSSLQASSLYPINLALAEEIERLLSESNPNIEFSETLDDIRNDFARNGRDVEYCPETPRKVKNKKKKKIMSECVFCKNNGEEPQYYKRHSLRNEHGKITCPVLRAYTCPICQNKGGDLAHTIKYCPLNNSPDKTPIVLALKTLRSSTGKRKTM